MKFLTTSLAVLAMVAMSCASANADTATIDISSSWGASPGTGSASGSFGTLNIASINSISVDVSHTWQGDLDFTLTGPDGSAFVIESVGGSADLGVTGSGAPGDEATYTFTDGAASWAGLGGGASGGALAGRSGNGEWSVTIDDPVGGDGGSVTFVTIDFNAIPEPATTGLVAGLFGLVALRRRK